MNIAAIRKEDCCGCAACFSVCPVEAINMRVDEKGFSYPQINAEKCIKCGLCYKVCAEKGIYFTQDVHAYAAKSNDLSVLKKATSGGVSFEFAKSILLNDGVVYGVVYNEEYEANHARISSIDECYKLFGSKYVQSDSKDSMKKLCEDLKVGKQVIYFGTSCYVAGLLSLLKKKGISTENLITVDLICHGVPSPKLFREYIEFLKMDKRGFQKFDFRTKKLPWGYGSKNFGCTIYYRDGKEETDTAKARLFLNLFFSNNCIREHCNNCEYCGVNKPSDITIADYWGLKEQHPDFFDEKGVSAVITHNEKGDRFFKGCDIDWIESTVDKISIKQANMSHPSPRSTSYDEFWNDYKKGGFMKVARKYGGYNIKGIVKHSRFYKKLTGK